MTPDVILILLSAGLTTVGVCVGWLVVRIIDNSSQIAVIESRLGEADIAGNFAIVHDRITKLSECTHSILATSKSMERRQERIEDYLMRHGSELHHDQ